VYNVGESTKHTDWKLFQALTASQGFEEGN
jgi:hypothetical protein